jgi:poly-gamma-glutamate capsule biosynthesis protein CapA/YwtB (metallophosphatase superfamily)
MEIAFTGDVMLGRAVNQVLGLDNFSYVWGDTKSILKKADLTLVNLECVISSKGRPIRRIPQMFHFRAHPSAVNVLKAAGVDYVSIANNHALDYEEEALLEMISLLKRNKISFSGAGKNLREAMEPAILKKKQLKIAVIALTDNWPQLAAKQSSPGVFYMPIQPKEKEKEILKKLLSDAKKTADFIFVSAHVGPHFRDRPADAYKKFARMLIDFGADVYWGHSNHIPQGIEIYKEKIILYDTGDFVDDYAVDQGEFFSNDQSFIFILQINKTFEKIELMPVKIDSWKMQVNTAKGGEAKRMLENMQKACAEFETESEISANKLIIAMRR